MRRLTITMPAGPVTHELTDELITLGRSPDNMIQIDDPSVSGTHAQLHSAGDDHRIVDAGSTNGTHVNGVPVEELLLRGGERLRFGKVEAVYETEKAGDAAPLPATDEAVAVLAHVSACPVDFQNASPFPRRKSESDRTRLVLFALAAAALLAFIASMISLAQMSVPVP